MRYSSLEDISWQEVRVDDAPPLLLTSWYSGVSGCYEAKLRQHLHSQHCGTYTPCPVMRRVRLAM
jgi:hypothetical protein